MAVSHTNLQELSSTAVFMLGEVQRDWSALGHSLVRIFLALDKVNHMLGVIIDDEKLFR